MKIHGRDIGLRFTCGASSRVASLCPENDISRLGELFGEGKDIVKMMEIIMALVEALNEGYELNRKYEEPGYEPNPITREELETLDMTQLMGLQDELIQVMTGDSKGEIEVEPPKGKKN